MNDFRSAIKSLFTEKSAGSDDQLNQYIEEIANENLENMSFQREFVEKLELNPSFEQISQDRVTSELVKDITVLKSLEVMMQERSHNLSVYVASAAKTKWPSDTLLCQDSTLNSALQSFHYFIDHELLQMKQQLAFSDIKKEIQELRHELKAKLAEYQRDLAAIEKEVLAAEKKASKSRENLEKLWEMRGDIRDRGRFNENDASLRYDATSIQNNTSNQNYGPKLKLKNKLLELNLSKDFDDLLLRTEQELKYDVRALLRSISTRDQIFSACRRAHQKLDRDCKIMISSLINRFVAREKESEATRKIALDQLENAARNLNIDNDLSEFVLRYRDDDNTQELTLFSQALSILNDLSASNTSGNPTSSAQVFNRSPSISSDVGPFTRTNTQNSETSDDNSNYNNGTLARNVTVVEPTYNLSSITKDDFSQAGSRKGVRVYKEYTADTAPKSTADTTGASSSTASDLASLFSPYFSGINRNSRVSSAAPAIIPSDDSQLAALRPTSLLLTDRLQNELRAQLQRQQQALSPLTQQSLLSVSSERRLDRPLSARTQAVDISTVPYSLLVTSTTGDTPNIQASINPLTTHERNYQEIESDLSILFFAAEANDYSQTQVVPLRQTITGTSSTVTTQLSTSEIVERLNFVVETAAGRQEFIHVLNQFRSRQVVLSTGFEPLGLILRHCLQQCAAQQDIHSAKIIMMLSQTFYRDPNVKLITSRGSSTDLSTTASTTEFLSDQVAEQPSSPLSSSQQPSASQKSLNPTKSFRSVSGSKTTDSVDFRRGARVYLKEMLCDLPIWRNKNFWEQALWDCVTDQMHTIRCSRPWYLMDRSERAELVYRVHNVVFSQVMAITHSMLELGCAVKDVREFLYRVCTVHQLGERHRQQLLQHLHGFSDDHLNDVLKPTMCASSGKNRDLADSYQDDISSIVG